MSGSSEPLVGNQARADAQATKVHPNHNEKCREARQRIDTENGGANVNAGRIAATTHGKHHHNFRTPPVHPQWINYLRVDNATAATAKLVALGGHVLVQPQLDRHGERVAVVTDPFGAVFGLMEWSQPAPRGSAK